MTCESDFTSSQVTYAVSGGCDHNRERLPRESIICSRNTQCSFDKHSKWRPTHDRCLLALRANQSSALASFQVYKHVFRASTALFVRSLLTTYLSRTFLHPDRPRTAALRSRCGTHSCAHRHGRPYKASEDLRRI